MSIKRILQRFRLSRFIKGEKVVNKSLTLSHKRIFILPTKFGLGFVGLIILLLLIAFVYNNNLAYQLAFLLASIFFITILHSYQSLTALVIRQSNSQAVFAGESIGFEIEVDNASETDRFNLRAELETSLTFSVAAKSNKRLMLYAVSVKRGWHQLKTITLSSTYPLGLFRAWAPLYFSTKQLVYPKPCHVERPFPENEGNQLQALQNRTLSQASDDEFNGLKEFQQGDSIRHIHWKAFAKGQGLMSKQYAGNNLTECWLDYGQTPGHNTEDKLSQLCRWVIDAEKVNIKYGLSLPGFKLEPNSGERHYKKCLEALALY